MEKLNLAARRHYKVLGDQDLNITSALNQAADALDQASVGFIKDNNHEGLVEVARGWLGISQYLGDLREQGGIESHNEKSEDKGSKIRVGFQLPEDK